ncbi:MAG: site-specific DNA-methyltransferase [Opitutus sp.]|nr:site-specific DNA-methyltransferase [Opitutus sp.]
MNRIVQGDALVVMSQLPREFADLVVLDPPYNLTKQFGDEVFRRRTMEEYEAWFASWLPLMIAAAKPNASFYVCGDWRSSTSLHRVLDRQLVVRNRITWEREKGRGALANWKNASEDIWFCTRSDTFVFNVDAVKLKRRVIAPYRENGEPKDWTQTAEGSFRLTHPSNLMTDLTVPFWSMPENTDHPTQKPEKLIAKLILASSREGDVVLDPFLGSGTTAVVAKKLGRKFVGIEADETYCCVAARRLELAEQDKSIQGYVGGVFWERNSLAQQPKMSASPLLRDDQCALEFALAPSGTPTSSS